MGEKDKKKRLTVCGSFGFGNAGDEALPLALQDLSQFLEINVDIDVLGRFERPALPEVIGLAREYQQKQERLRGELMLVAGGGVIETAESAVLSRCSPYLRKSFTPTLALYGANVEFGVPYSWPTRWRIAQHLRQFDRLYVRDVLSAESLRSLMPGREIEVIGDTVLWLVAEQDLPEAIAHLNPYIAVTLASHVSWKDDPAWHQWLGRHLATLAEELNVNLVFVPCSALYDQDCLEHEKLAAVVRGENRKIEVYNWDQHLSPRQLHTILGRSLLTISMRLHGCVMAYAQKTPFVALGYHPKVVGFAQTVGWQDFCLPSVLPERQTQQNYGYSLAAAGILREDLKKVALRSLDYRNFEQLDILKQRLANAFLELWDLHQNR